MARLEEARCWGPGYKPSEGMMRRTPVMFKVRLGFGAGLCGSEAGFELMMPNPRWQTGSRQPMNIYVLS